MPVSAKDHLAQADHIEQDKSVPNTNDTPKPPQGKLASVGTFLLSLLYGFGKLLSFPFRKLYDFINNKQKTQTADQNPNKPDATSQSLPPPSPLRINGKDIEALFADSSEDDVVRLSTTKMLMQHVLSKDKPSFTPIRTTETSSTWLRESITPPIINKLLSQHTPTPVTIPSDPQCGVPPELLHDIQQITTTSSPSLKDIDQVKKTVFQTADKILKELQSSPDFAYIKQPDGIKSPHSLDDIRPFILNNASLQDIGFGDIISKGSRSLYKFDSSEKDMAVQRACNIYRLSEIYSQLNTMSSPGSKLSVLVCLPNYHPDLFNDKQVCSEALGHIAFAMFVYANEFTNSIGNALSTICLFIRQESINNELAKIVTDERSSSNPQRPASKKLHQELDRLTSMRAQRSLSQYPDHMCRLISHILDGSSQTIIEQDMDNIFQTMCKAKYGLVETTDEQRKEIINEVQLAFRRCVKEMKAILVIQHQEQAVKDGVSQKEIQQFLDTDDLVPELLEAPIHLIHNT